MRRKIILLMLAFFVVAAAGCGKDEGRPKDNKVLAKINKYELTTEDFKNEMNLTASNKYLSSDPLKAEEDLLDEIIMKKILLQEAQRQNFDKDRAFMKEIERYWEQALLKLLMRKKMDELSRNIVVTANEVHEAYERMTESAGGNIKPFEAMVPEIKDDIYYTKMQAAFDEWFRALRNKADVRVYKENL